MNITEWANAADIFIGSEGDNGEHMRDDAGWPYSVYVKRDEIGSCDMVICHGIQSRGDAEKILSLLKNN